MTERTITPSADRARQTGAAVLTAAGVLAGLGAAACCALPLLFATIGVGTASLLGLAAITAPYQGVLLAAAAASLAGAGILLWRGRRAATACTPGTACATGGCGPACHAGRARRWRRASGTVSNDCLTSW